MLGKLLNKLHSTLTTFGITTLWTIENHSEFGYRLLNNFLQRFLSFSHLKSLKLIETKTVQIVGSPSTTSTNMSYKKAFQSKTTLARSFFPQEQLLITSLELPYVNGSNKKDPTIELQPPGHFSSPLPMDGNRYSYGVQRNCCRIQPQQSAQQLQPPSKPRKSPHSLHRITYWRRIRRICCRWILLSGV